MTEPRIQYAKAADGVSIAFWTLGEGEPLVWMPTNPSHIQMEWELPQVRSWIARLAEKRRVVRYDWRGCGLSDRDAIDHSLDALVLDLEAVVDRLGSERFSLAGSFDSGPPAIAYAARHSERVSHLLLWCTYARGCDAYGTQEAQAWSALTDKDWKTFTETVSHSILGWADSELAGWYAALMREATTPEAAQAMFGPIRASDVTDLLPRVKSPTLVLLRRSTVWPPANLTRDLASRIPGAQLVVLEGTSPAPFLGDTATVISAIENFLGEGRVPEPTAGSPQPGLVTILFTDMESSTALTQRLGDAKAQELVRAHNTIVRDALRANGGSEIKHTGDGIMASFTTASGALESAVAIQRAVTAHVEQHTDSPLGVHIGLNAGEPVAEEADLFGTAVQLARRICDHAEAGQVLVSNVVRELAAGKSFLFSDIGDVVPKGFDDAVRLYEVRWREET